jgi:hypothetical protein
MKTIDLSGSLVLGMGLLTAPAAFADLIVGAPIDVVGNLPAATFVGDHFATQSYKDWGNEPFVAVNPINTKDVVISSFSFGAPRNPDAALFYSTNGGANWTLQFTVPQPSPSVAIPNDWTFAYDSAGTLRNRANVWHYPGANSFARCGEEGNLLALHPTVKPVALVADAILDCSARGDIMLDGFLGSGTTVIAAKRTGRRCYGLELDTAYVDTIVRRWQVLTGDSAIQVGSGRCFDELAREVEATNAP